MSMTSVRPYFRSVMNARGYKEHKDGFNDENIGRNVIDKAYHIKANDFRGLNLNQTIQEVNCPVTVTAFIKGLSDISAAIDRAILEGESIVKDACATQKRLTGQVKNCTYEDMVLEAASEDNDNIVKMTIRFNVLVMIDVN